LIEDQRRALSFISVGIPADNRASGLARGKFLVRNVIGINQERGVVAVACRPNVGDLLGFVLRGPEGARTELKAMLERLAAQQARPPACGLYFDCISRGSALYNLPDHDSAYIGQQLGNVPIAGLFTGFEIGPLADSTGVLQYSGVLALIGDKSD
jgi:small ligand-binding sensory domain FIST